MATEHVERAYDDGHAKVIEARKVLQDHANLVKDKESLELQMKVRLTVFVAEGKLKHETHGLNRYGDIPWLTEALAICIPKSVRSRSKYVDDLTWSFPRRSEGSFRWIFGCQGDLAHDPVSNYERARFHP
ncbi:hypothetical protein L3X38_024666 [Prunus dulcis]|uniref:Uncharacterized protein n=1 Tax=Prunus dulcis TaxID=3755 RepID=A0AAD4W0B7_PRUDU|nr:hypothetical protein L3X38_024666 [Prunus dulcis]